MTDKEKLIQRLNELRTENNLPVYDPKKLKMTTAEIEQLIYQLETPAEVRDAAKGIPLSDAALLAQLNVLRKRSGKKVLKRWQTGRDKLEKEISNEQAFLEQRARDAALKGTTKIADGANTKKTHTELHKNEIRDAMKKMRKKEASTTKRERRDTAKKIALWAGFKSSTVFNYLEAKDITRPTLAGDALKADIKAWLKVRDKIKPKRKGREKSPLRVFAEGVAQKSQHPVKLIIKWLKKVNRDPGKPLNKVESRQLDKFIKERPKQGGHGPRVSKGLNPAALAKLLKAEPRAVRIKLRKLESKIPKAWRIPDECWGIKKEHQKDILKLLGGE